MAIKAGKEEEEEDTKTTLGSTKHRPNELESSEVNNP